MGYTAWAPEGREGRYQAGPKGRSLEVGARRSPRLLVSYISHCFCCLPQINISYRSYCISCYQNTEAEPGPYYLLSSAAIYIQHWSPGCLYSRFIFFWYKITNSNDNFEIFIFVTLIFLSITHLTLTWPHVAPLQYMCILPPLIPPPLPPSLLLRSAHVSYMSVSQAGGVSGEYKSLDYSCLVSLKYDSRQSSQGWTW